MLQLCMLICTGVHNDYVCISVWEFLGGKVPTNGGNFSMASSPKFAKAILKPNE